MRLRSAIKTNDSKNRFHVTSMGVWTDAPTGKHTPFSRQRRRINKKLKWRFWNAHLTKRKRKQMQKMILSLAMLFAFSLLSICFGDAIFAPDEKEDAWIENSALASEALTPVLADTDTTKSVLTSKLIVARPLGQMAVFYSANGNRYHLIATCSGMKEAIEADIMDAKALGLTPCKRCNPPE